MIDREESGGALNIHVSTLEEMVTKAGYPDGKS